ncbi:MAG: YggT family protein [Chloroflexi bacterium]|nr:YggT family protein [Chloroflexota bacterium]
MPIVYNFIRLLFNLLSLAILARVILSWFNVNPFHPVVSFLDQITEPILGPLRRVIPPIGMIDITPIVALVLLQVIETILLSLVQSV